MFLFAARPYGELREVPLLFNGHSEECVLVNYIPPTNYLVMLLLLPFPTVLFCLSIIPHPNSSVALSENHSCLY